ncbi:protein fuzzy homolog [Diabrotica undecimpunctata]|uniref:protein fuzzy homolog n=1 Tax=Diabrotica undecimpunctata TaxID=50387 RepID=UPI003B634DDF
MSAYVLCGTSSGGLPILSRKKGNSEPLPFSITGSLNGIHMFGKPFGIDVLETLTDDYAVSWKEFEDSIIIIGAASGCSIDILNRLLEDVFNTIVLIVGIKELKMQRNIERLKRELRICFPVIDRLLDSLDCGDASNKHSSDIVGFTETILCTENHLIQIVLDSFTECVDSMFSCILVDGKIVAATESWWSLHPDELRLLSLFAVSDNATDSKDIPVFLPHKSPTVAFRFVVCTLIPEVQICCLCGPNPPLNEIELSATQCFRNSTDILNSAAQCVPRNFPSSYIIDTNILGQLLVNTSTKKYMISKSPQQLSKKTTTSSHRLDILRTFFYRAVLNNLINCKDSYDKLNNSNSSDESFSLEPNENIGIETYWCSEYHKCHALKIGSNVLCVLYNSTVPTHALKAITEKTLKLLISDKQVCW